MAEIPNLTAAQMEAIRHRLRDQYDLTDEILTDRAGRALAELARQRLAGSVGGKTIIVLAGKGQTGWAGLHAARYLDEWGAVAQVVLASPRGEMVAAGQTLAALEEAGVSIWTYGFPNETKGVVVNWSGAALLLDALLGRGLRGDPREHYADVIRIANASRRPIVSLDLPSGLDPTDGTIYSPTIDADATLAIGLPQTGVLEGWPVVGDLYVATVGVPAHVYERMGLRVDEIFDGRTVIPLGRPRR